MLDFIADIVNSLFELTLMFLFDSSTIYTIIVAGVILTGLCLSSIYALDRIEEKYDE
jgi:hypothetical protein